MTRRCSSSESVGASPVVPHATIAVRAVLAHVAVQRDERVLVEAQVVVERRDDRRQDGAELCHLAERVAARHAAAGRPAGGLRSVSSRSGSPCVGVARRLGRGLGVGAAAGAVGSALSGSPSARRGRPAASAGRSAARRRRSARPCSSYSTAWPAPAADPPAALLLVEVLLDLVELGLCLLGELLGLVEETHAREATPVARIPAPRGARAASRERRLRSLEPLWAS